MIRTKGSLFFLVFVFPALIYADERWALERSTITYHVSHTLHETEGVSHAARGKGVCHAGHCEFLIAVPVNSFDSGDSNRDLHMLQVSRGAQYPMVSVRVRVPETAIGSAVVQCDLEIQFAGETARYKGVTVQVAKQGSEARLSATIPATLSDFKIDPPSLMTIPVRNEMPIRAEMIWHPL